MFAGSALRELSFCRKSKKNRITCASCCDITRLFDPISIIKTLFVSFKKFNDVFLKMINSAVKLVLLSINNFLGPPSILLIFFYSVNFSNDSETISKMWMIGKS